jgi:hypothetical protein
VALLIVLDVHPGRDLLSWTLWQHEPGVNRGQGNARESVHFAEADGAAAGGIGCGTRFFTAGIVRR